MSVNSKARNPASLAQIIILMQQEIAILKTRIREKDGFSATETKALGTAGGTSAPGGSSGFLKTAGDTMVGPIAFFPKLQGIEGIDNSLDVSKDVQTGYSSRLIVSTAGGNTELETIYGASHAGQLLMLQGILTETFTIKHGLGNIRTFDGGDLVIEDNQNIWLIFDSVANEWAAIGASGGGGTGTNVSADLVADQTANLAVNDHIEFDRNASPTGHDGGIVLQTGSGQANGLFELKADKTYFLSGVVSPIKSAATQLLVAWYDVTNGQELGRRTVYDNANVIFLENQPKAEIILTPTTDVIVELRIVANTTPANLTGFFAITTHCHIFEFSGRNGAEGAAGTGASPAFKDPVRAKTVIDVPVLGSFNVITDGVTLVQDDRVLLTEQTTSSQNGIYDVGVVVTGSAPLTRSSDMNVDAEIVASIIVMIEEGTLHKDTMWQLISNNPLAIGVSDQVWNQFSEDGSLGPAGSDGTDASGTFILDGRIHAGFEVLNKMQQLWNIRAPTAVQSSMILIEAEDYDHGDFGGGATPESNPSPVLVIVGSNGNFGSGNLVTHSRSTNYGESWTSGTSLAGLLVTWGDLAYDPTAKVLLCTSNDSRVGRSTDKGVSFSTTGLGFASENMKWIPRLSLFIAVSNSTGTNVVWTSPDGITWTQRTTPAAIPDAGGAARFKSIEDAPGLGKIYCFGLDALNTISSVDGITWISETLIDVDGNASFPVNPTHLKWHEGQRRFIAFNGGIVSDMNTDGYFLSEESDPLTWVKHTIPTMAASFDITVIEGLSMWLLPGQPTTGKRQPLHFSHDGVNWIPMPSLHMRNQDYDQDQIRSQGLLPPNNIAISNNFNYIFVTGFSARNAIDATFIENMLYRTEVYFNNLTDETSFRDELNPR